MDQYPSIVFSSLLVGMKVCFGLLRIFIAQNFLSPLQSWQLNILLSDEAKTKLHTLGHSGRISKVQMTYEMLIWKGQYADVKRQAALPRDILSQVHELAL